MLTFQLLLQLLSICIHVKGHFNSFQCSHPHCNLTPFSLRLYYQFTILNFHFHLYSFTLLSTWTTCLNYNLGFSLFRLMSLLLSSCSRKHIVRVHMGYKNPLTIIQSVAVYFLYNNESYLLFLICWWRAPVRSSPLYQQDIQS